MPKRVIIWPDHARSKRSVDLSRMIQPTPVPKGGGFVASALLTAHGRVSDAAPTAIWHNSIEWRQCDLGPLGD